LSLGFGLLAARAADPALAKKTSARTEPSPTNYVEMEFKDPSQPGKTSAVCAFPGLKLPPETKVYAAGAYFGEKFGIQIDQSGHEATLMRVAVNSESPVALILGAYEPTIWKIGWTEGTEIIAVLLSGYHAQKINGLPDGVPVLNSSYDNKGSCGSLYISSKDLSKIRQINDLSQKLFQRSPEKIVDAQKGYALIGQPLAEGQKVYTAKNLDKSEFQSAGTPLAGEPGLREAMRKGWLKPASSQEYNEWQRIRAKNSGVPAHLIPESFSSSGPVMHNAYVVLDSEFVIPNGLYGAHSATFFLPPGMPMPRGNMGHCTVILLEDGRSTGPGGSR